MSRRTVLKNGALLTGALVIGGTGTAAAGIGDGRILDYHLNNINYDRERGVIESRHVHDASPADNDGEWVGSSEDPVVKDGAVGNAYAFNGNDEYIDVGAGISQAFISLTVSAWIKNSSEDSRYQAILERNYWNADDGFGMFLNTDKVSWGHYNGGPTVTSSQSVRDGNWHSVIGTMEPTDGGGYEYSIYVDGVHGGSAVIGRNVTSSTAKTGVGRRIADFAGDYYYQGSIDEVRIYDRALSSTEITDLSTMDEE